MNRWYTPAELALARLTVQMEAGQQVHNLQVVSGTGGKRRAVVVLLPSPAALSSSGRAGCRWDLVSGLASALTDPRNFEEAIPGPQRLS